MSDTQKQTRVALITGASRGIGAATARLLAKQGSKVIINYVQNEAAAAQIVTGIQAAGGESKAIKANVQDTEQTMHLIEETLAIYGRLDILVSNAPSQTIFRPFQQITWEEFMQPITGELKAAFDLTKAVIPIMQRQRYGRIVYTANNLAKHPSMPGSIGLGTAKASLVSFSKYIAQEFGPSGIIANTVAPGMVDSDLSKYISQERKQQIVAMTPLKRIATPEDVARVIAYLVSEENTFVTGVYTPVNGGMTMD